MEQLQHFSAVFEVSREAIKAKAKKYIMVLLAHPSAQPEGLAMFQN
ncbi:hypothetical protein ACVITL_006775 [Rhizobium pisi]